MAPEPEAPLVGGVVGVELAEVREPVAVVRVVVALVPLTAELVAVITVLVEFLVGRASVVMMLGAAEVVMDLAEVTELFWELEAGAEAEADEAETDEADETAVVEEAEALASGVLLLPSLRLILMLLALPEWSP